MMHNYYLKEEISGRSKAALAAAAAAEIALAFGGAAFIKKHFGSEPPPPPPNYLPHAIGAAAIPLAAYGAYKYIKNKKKQEKSP